MKAVSSDHGPVLRNCVFNADVFATGSRQRLVRRFHLLHATTYRKTWESIFRNPTPSSCEWERIEGLLTAFGCEVIARETKPCQVVDACDFFLLIEAEP